MNFLKYEIDAGPEDTVEVTLDNPANVQLMDNTNFENYRAGRKFHYYGGYAQQSPFRLRAPPEGHWFLVVDLGGSPGSVRAAARVINRAALGRTG